MRGTEGTRGRLTSEKKKLAVVSFTPSGQKQAERIVKELPQWKVAHAHKPEALKEWCRAQFETADALLFIGAVGIAVRTIAPFIVSKTTDPAVLVMDEQARHVISVLSGHIGGGNELTCILAERLGAEAVITTASDVNGRIAIDVFAEKNRLFISDMKKAKEAAAAIVAGKPVSFFCEGHIRGRIPGELSSDQREAVFHVAVTPCAPAALQGAPTLWLVPKAFVLGLGCKKGKTLEEIQEAVLEELKKRGIPMESIQAAATIDLKQQEEGLLAFCRKYNLPLTFYTAEELIQAPGEYEASPFVETVTGVDNVCERAAMRKAWEENHDIQKEESMIIEKTKKEGITLALVKRDWSVEFE